MLRETLQLACYVAEHNLVQAGGCLDQKQLASFDGKTDVQGLTRAVKFAQAGKDSHCFGCAVLDAVRLSCNSGRTATSPRRPRRSSPATATGSPRRRLSQVFRLCRGLGEGFCSWQVTPETPAQVATCAVNQLLKLANCCRRDCMVASLPVLKARRCHTITLCGAGTAPSN